MSKDVIRLSDNQMYRRRVETNFYSGNSKKSIHKSLSFSDGGGSHMNFVTQDQFNEYKEHTSTRFDNVDKLLNKIEDDTSSTKQSLKWLVGIVATTGVAMVIGFITIIVNLI